MSSETTCAATTDTPPEAILQSRPQVFSFLLLMSGFCGISYEILYARVLGNLIGDQLAVSTSILMTFLLGIGVGTRYAWKLWRHLWAIEASIGVIGVLFATCTGLIDTVLYRYFPSVGTGMGTSVVISSILLSLPAFLIGCSLPLFAGYLNRLDPERRFASAYSIYNIGAALTILVIEFSLVRVLGISWTLISVAVANVAVAATLYLKFNDLAELVPPATQKSRFQNSDVAALALASVASAVFQLLLVKIAQCVFGPFAEVFALVLAIVLLGVAGGAWVVRRFNVPFRIIMLANVAGLIWIIAGTGAVVELYAASYGNAVESYGSTVLLKLGILSLLMAVPSLTFGATIPALLTQHQNVARDSGHLLFISSVANAFGFLLMAFVLHQSLDYGPLLVVICGASVAAFLVQGRFQQSTFGPAIISMVVAVVALQSSWDEELLYLGHTSFHSTDDLEEARDDLVRPERFKGHQDVFAINWVEDRPYFFINGYTSISLNSPAEKIVGAFSSVFAPRHDEALVLGVGSGATAGTVGLMFDHTDAVEINPVVLENLYRMSDFNFDIEENPSVNIVLDDAIHFTKTSEKKYSLIINTVTTPLYFSSSKLYTTDFLAQIRERLTDDGIYITWVDSRVGDEGLNITLNSIANEFDHCALGCVKSSYFLLICSPSPVEPHQADLVAGNETLSRFFMNEHDLNPNWFHYGLLTDDAFQLISDQDAPLNTLDLPALEFSMTRLRKRGIDKFKKRLRSAMSLEQARRTASQVEDWSPFELVAHHHMLTGDSSITDAWADRLTGTREEIESGFRDAECRYFEFQADLVDSAEAHHAHAFRLMKAKRYHDAIDAFRISLLKDPGRNNSNFNLASCYERIGDLQSARIQYELELQVDADDKDVPFRLGRVMLRQGDCEEALRWIDKAIEIYDDSENQVMRGMALEGLGRLEESRQAFYDAMSLTPIDSRAEPEWKRLTQILDPAAVMTPVSVKSLDRLPDDDEQVPEASSD